MKRFDRFLATEFLLFSLLGLISVILIYDLINLIERMSYFLRYDAKVVDIALYYFYDLPATMGLLLPVGFALGVFLVIGRLIRSNELLPLLASGVNIYRIFAVFFVVSVIVAGLAFLEVEYISTRARGEFIDHKVANIEGRKPSKKNYRNHVFYLSQGGRRYYIRQLRVSDSLAKDWVIWELSPERRIKRTIKIPVVRYTSEGVWQGESVEVRDFTGSEMDYVKYPERLMPEITETPAELGVRRKSIEEMRLGELRDYIHRMELAGSKVAEERVEYHFRFSSPVIVIIVTMIALAAAALLHKGNITLGIGLGLLLSFLFWGALQASRAFGYASVLPPWLAAWLPNLIFSGVMVFLLCKVKT
ncbi:LptF/LptG family permease [candidate division WOR-3 bacterium]|uniref:LptF/LptG family permease n=1 Tax=candidate division WOR-3 bacterium TaxID=2052148 RepID=A0A9D5K8F4_UNCW3|nr:LptF/LptG family permease [candidate division WOR-3 bacterium]MBD3364368.1 LptF/LptG family permease [candidate division WOR-3 bacterium]